MRRLAAMVLVLLFAPRASAQQRTLQPQVQPAPAATLTPAQAGYDTATLLALYMGQLANSGKAPSQSDISEAARQYFTNGAAVSTVPTSGPGAAYFQNGAAVMSYGATPAPTVPAPPPVAQPVAVPVPVPLSAPDETATPAEASADTTTPASTAPGVTEAQAASSSSPSAAASPAAASPTTPAPPVQPLYQTIVVSPPAQPASDTEPEATCPPPPSFLSHVAPAFGGLFFGGLAVALWTRPRMLRNRDR